MDLIFAYPDVHDARQDWRYAHRQDLVMRARRERAIELCKGRHAEALAMGAHVAAFRVVSFYRVECAADHAADRARHAASLLRRAVLEARLDC